MLLNSPPAARTLKRKRKSNAVPIVEPPTKKATATAKSKRTSPSSTSSISSVIGDEPKMCISCLASSMSSPLRSLEFLFAYTILFLTANDKMFECVSCNGFYHVTCHNKATPAQAKIKEKFCPDCLRRQPKPTQQRNK